MNTYNDEAPVMLSVILSAEDRERLQHACQTMLCWLPSMDWRMQKNLDVEGELSRFLAQMACAGLGDPERIVQLALGHVSRYEAGRQQAIAACEEMAVWLQHPGRFFGDSYMTDSDKMETFICELLDKSGADPDYVVDSIQQSISD